MCVLGAEGGETKTETVTKQPDLVPKASVSIVLIFWEQTCLLLSFATVTVLTVQLSLSIVSNIGLGKNICLSNAEKHIFSDIIPEGSIKVNQ